MRLQTGDATWCVQATGTSSGRTWRGHPHPAALSRDLAADAPHRWDRPGVSDLRYRGGRVDRNTELLVPQPAGLEV